MLVTLVIMACVVMACMVVVQIVDFNIVIFKRACGRARGKVVVLKIEGTAGGCICGGGQMIAFRRFWRGV
jgi:hypothetical protein